MAATQQELDDIGIELGMLEHTLNTLISAAKLDGTIDEEEQQSIDELEQSIRAAKKRRDELKAEMAGTGSNGTEDGSSGGSASVAETPSDYTTARIVPGNGGYTYAQFPDGELVILQGPNGQRELPVKRGTTAWNAITAEIGSYSGTGSPSSSAPPTATGTLMVQVFDQRMVQVAGANVSIRGSGKTVTTGTDGTAIFYNLPAEEQVDVEVEFSNAEYTRAYSGYVERSAPIVADFLVSHTIVLDTIPKALGDEEAGQGADQPVSTVDIGWLGAPPDASPTFAQIYLAVQDGKFDSLRSGRDHLAALDRSELETLDSVCERRIEFYTELARKQKADPTFKPPKGVPDVWFESIVLEYEKFRNEILGPYLTEKRRTHKVADHQVAETIGTWLDEIRKSIGGDPIGCAVKNTLDLAEKIVEANLEEKDFGFSDKNILRIGYLDLAGVKQLLNKAVPEGKNDNELVKLQLPRMVKQIRDDGTVLPLQIANKILQSGRAGRNVSSDVIELAKDIDDQLRKAMGHANNQQISGTPGKSSKGFPANAIWYWFQQLSDSSQNPNSVYSCYAKEINAWTASGS